MITAGPFPAAPFVSCLQNERPSRPGRVTSRRTTEGRQKRATSQASSAEATSSISNSSAARVTRRSNRSEGSSSTTKTRRRVLDQESLYCCGISIGVVGAAAAAFAVPPLSLARSSRQRAEITRPRHLRDSAHDVQNERRDRDDQEQERRVTHDGWVPRRR